MKWKTLLLVIVAFCGFSVQGQSYLGLDGGFEGGTVIDNSTTYTGAQSAKWSKNNTSTTLINETTTVRSGSNSLKINNSSTTGRRVYSPLVAVSTTSQVVVQYYRRVASTTNCNDNQHGIMRNTTESLSGTYDVPSAANTWEKVTYVPTGTTNTSSVLYAEILSRSKGTGGDLFVDDFCMYVATAVDNTAPNSATSALAANATTSSLDVSWTAASGGVDNGGYMVVRYATNPNADNDPLVNGIYATGNTYTTGTGSLTGTVVYVGTGTSFTNTGLAANTSYYYKVYTFDKAYNYAAEASATGTTLSAAVAAITVSNNGSQVTAANVTTGTNNLILSSFTVAVTTANTNLTSANFITLGNYQASDINSTGFKLWYKATNDFSTAAQIGTSLASTSTGTGDILGFTSLSQTITAGNIGYFWITANIATGATPGRTISLDNIANADLIFSSGTKSGSATAGGTQTITALTTPTITTSGTLSALSTTYGTASGTTTFTASGSALTNDITVTAPTGFEISTTAGSGYASSLVLTQSGGTVTSTTIYVRLAATTAAGSYSGNVVLTSTGAASVNVATVSSTVSTKTLTITGIAGTDKIYDRTTTATLTGTASLVGIVGSDAVTLSGTPTASFTTATVANAKPVTVSGYTLAGATANYTLTQPTGLTANITAKPLTIAGAVANNKTYDTTTAATIAGTLTGVISPDVVTLSATGTFAGANVGTAIIVTSTSTLGGAGASNYSLTQPTGLTANITQASQTITFGALPSKVTSDVPFALTATASSGLAITYVSSDIAVATVSGTTVTIVGVGTTTITASQAGNTNYAAATDVPQSLIVTTGPCLSEGFDSSTLVPSGWGGTSTNDTSASHYQSAGNCRALSSGVELITDVANYPSSISFYVDASGSGGQIGTLYYQIGSGTWNTVGSTFSATTAGATVTYDLTSSPNLSTTANIKFKISSATNTIYIDDLKVYCAAPCVTPTISATSLTINNATSASLNLNYTRGNGNGVIIIAKSGSAPTIPTNGTTYNLGDAVGGGTVVYTGTAAGASTATSQVIASLTEGTQYYFSIYEYNSATSCYQDTALTASAYTLSTEPTAHSTFTNTVIAYNQINLSFPTTGIGADGFVILRRTDGVSPTISGITDGVAPASWTLPGGTTLVTTTTSGTTYNNTGLTGATTYCYLLIPYNWNASNAATYNYYTAGTVPSTCGTTPTAPSTNSDITTDTAFTYNSNINYLNWQSGPITNVNTGLNGSVGVHKIIINDGGSSAPDTDNLPTILNAITFTYTGTANTIKSAALFSPSNVLIASSVTAGANTITFPTLSGTDVTAPDNGSISLILRVTFNDAVTDNQKLVFAISAATSGSSSTSSQFAAANAGAATSDNSADDKNRLEVTADRLAFAQQPSTGSINVAMAPTVTVSANDINGNRDLDFTSTIAITSTGTLTGTPVNATAVSGLASYSSLTHTAVGTGLTLTATTTGLTSNTVVSGTFSITTITYANNDYRSASSGTWLGTATATWEKYDSATNSWASSSPPTAATANSVYILHAIATGNPFANSINIKVLSGGSFTSSYNSTANSIYIYNGGTFIFQSNSLTINNGFEIEDGGTFIFNYTSNAGSLLTGSLWKGVENFHPNSNFIIQSHDTGTGRFFLPVDTAITAQTYNGVTAYFGNLIIDNATGQTGNMRLSSGGNFNNKTVTHKDLIFRSSNNTNFIITDTAVNLTIGNNLVIESGYSNNVSISTSAITAAITVNGDFINASSNAFNLANNASSANITLNVNGNIQLSSGSLNLNAQSGSTAVANLKGDLTVATAATITSTATSGSTFNFTGTGDGLTAATTQNISITSTGTTRNQYIGFWTNSGSYVQLADTDLELGTGSSFTPKTGSTFDFGFNNTTPLVIKLVSGATTTAFTSQTGSTLKITSPDGIIKTANTTNGNVQGVAVSSRTFSQTGIFHYIGKANQVTGDAITSGGSAKTIICEMNADNLQLSLTNSTSITTPGLLNIKKGQVIESPTAYITGSTGGLTMENNTLYQIPALSASASDFIPRMSGISSDYTLNGGTIQLNGAGDQELRGQRSYRNLTFSTSGTKTVSSSPTIITGTITTENTTILDVTNKTMGGIGTNLTMTGSSRYISAGTGTKPDAQGTYILNTGTTVEFNNSAATLQEIRLTPIYYNIDISGTNAGTDTLSGSINMQSGSTFTVKSTATFKNSNTTGFAKGLATAVSSANNPILFLESGSTVEYAGSNQNITDLPLTPATSTYSNLKISGTGQKTIPAAEVLVGNDLTITNSGSELQIGANQLLTVTNIINAPTNAEKILIANTGNLVQLNEGVSNSGRMNMRRDSRSMALNDYIYWGTPVTESLSMPLGVTAAYMWDLNGTQDGTWNYYSASVPGRGFITRMGSPGQLNFDFKGTPNTGQINVAALNYDGGTDHTGNTILLSNPYPSAIDALKFVTDPDNTELKGTLYFWTSFTPVNANQYTVNDYASWNITGSTATSDLSNTLGLVPNGKITAGQGFFAEMNTSGTVSFHNSMRVRTLTDNTQFFRSAAIGPVEPEQNRIWLNITNTAGVFRQALVGYVTGATNEYERLYDGNSFTGNEVNIYSLIDDRPLVIQGRALPFNQTDLVPLGVKVTTAGTYSITIDHKDGLFIHDNQNIYLQDLVLGTIYDLNSGSYTFTTQAGVFNDRFVLRYTNENLSVGTFDPDNGLQLAVNKNILKIKSTAEPINQITVFDISGRKVYEQKAVASTEFEATDIVLNHQALIVKITFADGQTVSRKIIY